MEFILDVNWKERPRRGGAGDKTFAIEILKKYKLFPTTDADRKRIKERGTLVTVMGHYHAYNRIAVQNSKLPGAKPHNFSNEYKALKEIFNYEKSRKNIEVTCVTTAGEPIFE